MISLAKLAALERRLGLHCGEALAAQLRRRLKPSARRCPDLEISP